MKYLRVKSVAKLLDMSESTVWRAVQQGILPPPTKLTPRTTVWREIDIDAAIEKIAEDGGTKV
ncbi:helix-turn-helix transcriptional regulator [Spongiibacter marinus]|uniref:helix-turn-helix transcriptional regulator n=1 Tax=Spongiibacter marinus TaxID=354246 RepID=UPI0004874CE4|nr:AlpA family phage regulatory protein [Spongiibacter marinus]